MWTGPRQAFISTGHVIFLAAENAAFPKGKVGGVGDVVRDLPLALGAQGWRSTVLTPAYGMFHKLPGAKPLDPVNIQFGADNHTVAVYEVPCEAEGVRNVVFEHAGFSPHGAGQVYSENGPARPFATDAAKFALFAAAAAAFIDGLAEEIDVVHLHDWHAALYLLMRQYGPHYDRLRDIHTVFTIHNLSYQGVRPLAGDMSSLESWFPGLEYLPEEVGDPSSHGCINPMAMAIRLADRISTVSPTYAGEICEPSDDLRGFIGGEGLESLLSEARDDGRLVGILNGCYYDGPKGRRPGWQRILGLATEQLNDWQQSDAGEVARATLGGLPKRRPHHVLTSIGRLVRQKAALFFEKLPDGRTALEAILDMLGSKGVLVVIGSGESEYEQRMLDIAKNNRRLLFLCGYSETLADPLYRAGDLFLMPSSFEPCGISQMLAMRATQPCVVHGVGGLKDTVDDGRNGFVFQGDSPADQARNFVATVEQALELRDSDHDRWQKICIRAASARFSWRKSAQQTIELLYGKTG